MLSRSAKFLIAVALAAAAGWAAPAKPSIESIRNQIYCMCGGCVAVLAHCPHMESECASKSEMQAVIRKEIAAGKDETAILQDLVLRYGVKVLASPPAKGFDLTVWVLPGIGLLIGLGVVVAIVRRWRKPAAAQPAEVPVDPKVLAAIEEEMKEVTGPPASRGR